jgi:hypothetical protein
MSRLFKGCTALLISLCTLNITNVNGAYFSSIQDDGIVSSSVQSHGGSLMASHEEADASPQSVQMAQADNDTEHQDKNCGGRHLAHHHCHQGHCGFAASLSSLSVELPFGFASRLLPSESSLTSVEFAGPRKPPRA